MSMYKIEIEEILSRTINVKADSHEDAIEKVKRLYDNSEIVLDADDFSEVNFKDLGSINDGEVITRENGCMFYVKRESYLYAKREPYIYIRNKDGKVVTRRVISVDAKNKKAKIRLDNKVVYVKYFCRWIGGMFYGD